ncbi:unnamed protein product [Ilex paraguariensis]|uniref:Mitochondrial import inner membrane translocase subunit TIM50 n=1 Tax=Ilex paraguariensis TaxID=185542 RepID=A0ABC8UTR1_9AQUA
MSLPANSEDGLQSKSQKDMMSTLSLSDKQNGQGSDDRCNKVQSPAQEFGFHAREGPKQKHIKEERHRLIKSVRKKTVKPFSQDGQHDDSTSICDPSMKHMAEENKKRENKLQQAVEGSFISGKNTQPGSQRNGKHPSFDSDVINHVSLVVASQADNLVKVPHATPQRALVVCSGRKLLILDVNGVLADIVSPPPKEFKADIYISRRAIFKRPFCFDFLKFCFDRFDVGIWSSRTKKNIDSVVDYLLGDMKQKLLFCWVSDLKFFSVEFS